MSNYLIQDETLVSIANPIRELIGNDSKLSPNEMSVKLGSVNNVVTEQAELISQIMTLIEEKSGGTQSLKTTSLTVVSPDMSYYITYLTYVNGALTTQATISMGSSGDIYTNIPVGAFVSINTNSTMSNITGTAKGCNIIQTGLHDKAWTVQVGQSVGTFTISM